MSRAYELAEEHLTELPRRWQHSLGVWRQARSLRQVVDGDAGVLEAAGLLHDIGYSPRLVQMGFHAVDGARFLRSVGVDERVVSLVAHHSCAALEARERGLVTELAEFSPGEALLSDALIYCDMTSGPSGEVVTPEERVAEIVERYGQDGPVGRFIRVADPLLKDAAQRIVELLGASEAPAALEHP